jgi:hypothetical protein
MPKLELCFIFILFSQLQTNKWGKALICLAPEELALEAQDESPLGPLYVPCGLSLLLMAACSEAWEPRES